jgi:hypothetical protein
MPIEPPVAFNMDLANAPTGARFCREAADVLNVPSYEDEHILRPEEADPEELDEMVQMWSDRLFEAGYYVWWNAGDVVVWDLRDLSDADRDAFEDGMADA